MEEARRLVEASQDAHEDHGPGTEAASIAAQAQVHATLALVAAVQRLTTPAAAGDPTPPVSGCGDPDCDCGTHDAQDEYPQPETERQLIALAGARDGAGIDALVRDLLAAKESANLDVADPTSASGAVVEPEWRCGCYACTLRMFRATVQAAAARMIVCPECGNKRCPHATHHDHPCSGSNAPGQPGSRYA